MCQEGGHGSRHGEGTDQGDWDAHEITQQSEREFPNLGEAYNDLNSDCCQ